ncbi:MAG TPA: alpha-E domain-containing protein [Euryarchaeota archaeon]|nr:alpha-E domain-containing protein [Euryarchaeota archaeon]
MSNITTEKANELFWLGRYVERVYTTCMEFFKGYDRMIDEREVSYPEYCRRVSIPNVYAYKEDFLRSYPFDESNPDSIISNLIRAYDNAVVLRDDIGSDTLSYIQLAIYDMRKASLGVAPLIGLQTVVDDLFAFWGCMDDRVVDYSERSIVKAARRIERIDLYLRFGMPADTISFELRRLENRIVRTGLEYDQEAIPKLREMLSRDPVPYGEAIELIESMVDV